MTAFCMLQSVINESHPLILLHEFVPAKCKKTTQKDNFVSALFSPNFLQLHSDLCCLVSFSAPFSVF